MDGIRHYGKIQGAQMRFTPRNREKFERALQSLEGRDFELSIHECSEPVTDDQHAYYRSFVRNTLVGCEIFGGWGENRIHEFFQGRFLSYSRIEIVSGQQYAVTKVESTANIGKKRMAEFIEQVIAWCAEEGITIGSPEDYFAGKYKTKQRKIKFSVGQQVHVKTGLVNYIGNIDQIIDNSKKQYSELYGETVYVINDHCYEEFDLTPATP